MNLKECLDAYYRYYGEERLMAVNVDALDKALVEPYAKAFIGGRELYPEMADKAAALFAAILKFRPFPQGNLAFAFILTVLFIHKNGWRLSASNEEVRQFLNNFSKGTRANFDIKGWFARRMEQVRD
ncbi:hypothetical protein [Carboxydothermus pertinax]|uniref:Death-on-curing protein n=1 Tax=Carboxydothermus pertinax TaxID=870242 RepID=A0A1L8CRL2_9THEO|nr:hypothetical protein [Carboxydothermus pertinax]GAV21537.1 hypothetical protein cpu_00470 [Carboxydothermus pertinax]